MQDKTKRKKTKQNKTEDVCVPCGSPLSPGLWLGENLLIRHPNARLSANAIETPLGIRSERVGKNS